MKIHSSRPKSKGEKRGNGQFRRGLAPQTVAGAFAEHAAMSSNLGKQVRYLGPRRYPQLQRNMRSIVHLLEGGLFLLRSILSTSEDV